MKHVFITFISARIIIKYNYNIIHINAEFVQKYKKGAFQWASRPPTGDQPVTRSQWNASG